MIRGSRTNSQSQPTIDAAISATPSASAADPPVVSKRETTSQVSPIVMTSAVSRRTTFALRQCGTIASANSSNAAVPIATVDSSTVAGGGRTASAGS